MPETLIAIVLIIFVFLSIMIWNYEPPKQCGACGAKDVPLYGVAFIINKAFCSDCYMKIVEKECK